jgi:hypothetical protein
MTMSTTVSRPMAEQIILGIKMWVGSLEADYDTRLKDGPEAHLMSVSIDQITALCRMLAEIIEMEMDEANMKEKQEQKTAEVKKKFIDLVHPFLNEYGEIGPDDANAWSPKQCYA